MRQILSIFILFIALAGVCDGFRPLTAQSSVVRGSRVGLSMRWGLDGPQANKPMGELPEGTLLRDTVPFELRGISLPLVVFSIGFLLTGFSFVGFFLDEGGGQGAFSSLGFVYGIPVFLIGLSLWYAEIPPANVVSSPAGDKVWEELATDTFKKIKQDVTRHRYGDDAHLDSSLEALGLKLPQKKYPKLQTLTQEATPEGELAFTLTFQSAETPYKVWADPDRIRKYETFFGPSVTASVSKVDAKKRLVALRLVTNTKGASVPAAATTSTGEGAVATEVASAGAAEEF